MRNLRLVAGVGFYLIGPVVTILTKSWLGVGVMGVCAVAGLASLIADHIDDD